MTGNVTMVTFYFTKRLMYINNSMKAKNYLTQGILSLKASYHSTFTNTPVNSVDYWLSKEAIHVC